MKNYELLDMIGDVNEDYVHAADSGIAGPSFHWKTWAACAACAALVLCAYPVWRQSQAPQSDEALPAEKAALHDYVVLEDGGIAESILEDEEAVTGGASALAPAAAPGAGADDGMERSGTDGAGYSAAIQDAAVQEEAAAQYDSFLQNGGISYGFGGSFPEWYGGAWLDNDCPDGTARLTVAVVDGLRTQELEAQIKEWCGGTGEVLLVSVKYSYARLQSMMEEMNADSALEQAWGGAYGGFGIDVTANCIEVDVFADEPPESLLAALAEYDPEGDVIRVQVHTGSEGQPEAKCGMPD